MTQATQNPVVVAQPTELTTNLIGMVRRLDNAMVEYSDSRKMLGLYLAKHLPFDISFAAYEAIRLNFVVNWKGAEGQQVSDEAKRQAWSRAIGAMNDTLSAQGAETFKIPKSENEASAKKQAQREAAKKQAEAVIAEVKKGIIAEAKKSKTALSALDVQKAVVASLAKNEASADAVKLAVAQRDEMVKAATKELRDDTKSKLKDASELALRIARAAATHDAKAMATILKGEWPEVVELLKK